MALNSFCDKTLQMLLKIQIAVDNGNIVAVVTLDLEKAFDFDATRYPP